MSDTKTFDFLIKIISSNEDLEPLIPIGDIVLETRIQEDLGFDSLATMAIVYEIQETYEDFDETVMASCQTIAHVVEKIKEHES